MASAIMHIAVANQINKVIKMNNEILIGSIAPDISKLIKQPRRISHYHADNNEVPDLEKFLKTYDINSPYNLGYFIHLLTDKIWFEDFLPIHYEQNKVRLSNVKLVVMNETEKDKLIYEDYNSITNIIIEKYNLNLDFLNYIYNIDTDIKIASVKDIKILLNEVIRLTTNTKIKPLNIFKKEEIFDFIDKCVEEGLHAISKQKKQIRS